MNIIKSIFFSAACFATAGLAQTVIQGGERFAFDALPGQIVIAMPQGEKRVFALEETLANGCLWSARPQNAAQQLVVTHTLQEATGGLAVPMGAAAIEITGNVPGVSVIDFVLVRPGDATAQPVATVRAQLTVGAPAPVIVQPAPVVVAPQPAPVVVPARPLPPPPPRPVPLKREFCYEFKEIPAVAEIMVPKNGNGMQFFLDCPKPQDYEWIAVWRDNADLRIDVINEVTEAAYLTGHKHKRTIRGTSVEFIGYHPCDLRVRLEYRRKDGHRMGPPAKAIDCFVRVR